MVDSPILLSYVYFKYNKIDKIIDDKIFRDFTFELIKSLNLRSNLFNNYKRGKVIAENFS